MEFLQAHYEGVGTVRDLLGASQDRLTYVQVVEIYGGSVSKSPRERNLLNVLALMPCLQPIGSTGGICDKSQRISRTGLRTDGNVGTMVTGASMWSFDDGALAAYDICLLFLVVWEASDP